jgi:hypothetical protein
MNYTNLINELVLEAYSYSKKYNPGMHYVEASNAIQSEIGIVALDKGKMVAQGTISKNIEKDLLKKGLDVKSGNEGKFFELDYKTYQEVVDKYWKEKDDYIKKHDLYKG